MNTDPKFVPLKRSETGDFIGKSISWKADGEERQASMVPGENGQFAFQISRNGVPTLEFRITSPCAKALHDLICDHFRGRGVSA